MVLWPVLCRSRDSILISKLLLLYFCVMIVMLSASFQLKSFKSRSIAFSWLKNYLKHYFIDFLIDFSNKKYKFRKINRLKSPTNRFKWNPNPWHKSWPGIPENPLSVSRAHCTIAITSTTNQDCAKLAIV